MGMPNFLVIGAAKAGTTALHDVLAQHPKVYMSPIKEPNFFALEGHSLSFARGSVQDVYLSHCITTLAAYQEQFQPNTTQISGDVSPIYLYSSEAPARIYHYLPDVKLIAILRDPIQRAYSNFLHHIRDDLETCTDFLQAVQQEPLRIADHWWWGFHYVQAGFYYQQLRRYFDRFQRHQIQVYLYEDLLAGQIDQTLKNIFQFLEIDSTFVPDLSMRHNVTGIPKSRTLHNFLSTTHPIKNLFKPLVPETVRKRWTNRLKNQNLVKPDLPLDVRAQLLPVFRDDILQLQDLIQRDLSAWLQ